MEVAINNKRKFKMEEQKQSSTKIDNNDIFSNYPDVVSIEDLTQMLRIGRNKAYELVNTNAIKSIKIGRKYIIPKFRVIEFLQNIK